MTARFIHDGNSIDHTPSTDVAAGAVIVQGDLIGIAKVPIPAGTSGALAVTGVFDVPKATGVGSALGSGVKVYWDAGNSVATTDDNAGANKYLGKTVDAASDDDAIVRVRLEQ